MNKLKSTTILGLRYKGQVAMGSDGQVTLENTILKSSACKIRKLYNGKVLVGFAGGVADALTLFERFEAKLNEYHGNLERAVVELVKEWRTDRVLRRLEAMVGILDANHSYIVSGGGDIIDVDDGIVSLGSGGPYALACAKALIKHSKLNAKEIVEEAIKTAASICVYTNEHITVETL